MPIRAGAVADVPALAAVQVASWKAAYRGLLSDAFLDGLTVEGRLGRWQARFAEPGTDVLVWEEEGRVLGYCVSGASRDGDADAQRCGELHAIYLLPEAWGKGGGAALCRAALDALRRRGFSTVTLWVLRQNTRARAFYERVGFAVDGAEQLKAKQPELDLEEVRYRRALS